jgi:hypothetical protein
VDRFVSILWHSARGFIRVRNANLFAANQIFDSFPGMVRAINSDSKLCAEVPRHATGQRLSAGAVAQLGKGRLFVPPRCIPSRVPQAAPASAEASLLHRRRHKPETVPVSAPFGLHRVVAFRSWEMRP